jgi:hypothetical protein
MERFYIQPDGSLSKTTWPENQRDKAMEAIKQFIMRFMGGTAIK